MERLQHDCAWMLSQHILEIFAPCLREEEQADAFAEVYARCRAAFEAFCIQEARMQRRLQPSKN
jgi:hypothetical protein